MNIDKWVKKAKEELAMQGLGEHIKIFLQPRIVWLKQEQNPQRILMEETLKEE